MHPRHKATKARLAAMSYSQLGVFHEQIHAKGSLSVDDVIVLELLAHELDTREDELTEHRRRHVEEDYGSFDCVH
jgi:hypothetical protein